MVKTPYNTYARRFLSLKDRFMSLVKRGKKNECWMWQGNRGGWDKDNPYGRFSVSKNVAKLAHRFSYELFNGKIPEGQIVRHKCDVPLCVNPMHLVAGSYADNSRDRENRHRRRIVVGEEHKCSKLSDDKVREIRRMARDGKCQRRIAEMFDISPAQLNRVVKRTAWSHVV